MPLVSVIQDFSNMAQSASLIDFPIPLTSQ